MHDNAQRANEVDVVRPPERSIFRDNDAQGSGTEFLLRSFGNNRRISKHRRPGHNSPTQALSQDSVRHARCARGTPTRTLDSTVAPNEQPNPTAQRTAPSRPTYFRLISDALQANPDGLRTRDIISWLEANRANELRDHGKDKASFKSGTQATLSAHAVKPIPRISKRAVEGPSGRRGYIWTLTARGAMMSEDDQVTTPCERLHSYYILEERNARDEPRPSSPGEMAMAEAVFESVVPRNIGSSEVAGSERERSAQQAMVDRLSQLHKQIVNGIGVASEGLIAKQPVEGALERADEQRVDQRIEQQIELQIEQQIEQQIDEEHLSHLGRLVVEMRSVQRSVAQHHLRIAEVRQAHKEATDLFNATHSRLRDLNSQADDLEQEAQRVREQAEAAREESSGAVRERDRWARECSLVEHESARMDERLKEIQDALRI